MSQDAKQPPGGKAKPRKQRSTSSSSRCKYASSGATASREARRRATGVLEVLAGVRTPAEAAQALQMSPGHYYLLERKALAGLLAACEPKAKGAPAPDAEKQLATLQRELEQCRRECLRQAALVRATQRALGLPVSSSSPANVKRQAGSGGGKRRRTARALRAVATLQKNSSGEDSDEALERVPTRQVTEDTSRTNSQEQDDGAPR